MYIIPGVEQIALTLWYRRSGKTLVMYPIIIADIAPKIPGDLTHFNWPGCCEISQYTGFITRPTIGRLHMHKKVHNGETEKRNIFIRIN